MSELEDELVNDSIDAYRAADEFQLSVVGVVEDEVAAIELGKLRSSNASRQLKTDIS